MSEILTFGVLDFAKSVEETPTGVVEREAMVQDSQKILDEHF
jgi:hypothetical protein